jgi:prepilin-type N-terminal cleavage/methylation domain-containing protein
MFKQKGIAVNARGFTLIELLVVVGIISIFVAIATTQFLEYLDKAKITVGIAALDSIRPNMETYRDDHQGSYPQSINFADFTDQNGARIIISSDPSAVISKLYSWSSYTFNSNSYMITAQALDKKHTVLNLTPHGITR